MNRPTDPEVDPPPDEGPTEILPMAEAGHLVGGLLTGLGVDEAGLVRTTQTVLRAQGLRGVGLAALLEALDVDAASVASQGVAAFDRAAEAARAEGVGLTVRAPLAGLPLALALPDLAAGTELACLVCANPTRRAPISAVGLSGGEGVVVLEHVDRRASRAHARLATLARDPDPPDLAARLAGDSALEGASREDGFELIVELLADIAVPAAEGDPGPEADSLLILCVALPELAHRRILEDAVIDRVMAARARAESGHLALRLPEEATATMTAAARDGLSVPKDLLTRLRGRGA